MGWFDDGKEDGKEQLLSRLYWLIYPLTVLITALHVDDSLQRHDGGAKRWILAGAAFLVLAVLRHILQ